MSAQPVSQQSEAFTLRFSSEPLGVRAAVARATEWLRACQIDAQDCGSAEILLAEVLNNVSEHSYGEDVHGDVELTVICDGDSLLLTVADQGRAMPESLLPDPDNPRSGPDPAALAEGGFGWFLIEQLTRDMRYRREGETNHLKLTMALSHPV